MSKRVFSYAWLLCVLLACGGKSKNGNVALDGATFDGSADAASEATPGDGSLHADGGQGDAIVAPNTRTFDEEELESCPSNARCEGTTQVEEVTVGGESTRAVRVHDTSENEQTRLLFLHGAVPARRFRFDVAMRSRTESTILAVHGTGASESTAAWRFLLSPKEGSRDCTVSVWDGAWKALGQAEGLCDGDAWSEVEVEASSTWASLATTRTRFVTTQKAAQATAITSLEIASSGTQPSGTDTYVDNLVVETTGWVVAQESDGNEPRFPDIARLQDGRLIAVYQAAQAHTGTSANASSIKMTFSEDNGQTWSAPRVAIDSPQDDRDPKIAVLGDGTAIMTWFQDDWTGADSYDNLGVFVARLAPGETTFGNHTRVPTSTENAFSHAPIVELANGNLLLPYYANGARIIQSRDGGATWDTDSDTLIMKQANRGHVEPNVIRLANDELVMVIRTVSIEPSATIQSALTRSADHGKTWSPLVDTGFVTSSHHMLPTSRGQVLLTYGDPDVTHRPTFAALITDPSAPWNPQTSVPRLLYSSGHGDQANPSSVELAPGRYLTLAYSVPDATLFAFETTDALFSNSL